LSRDVAIEAIQDVPECAAAGAFFGVVTVPAGLLLAPVAAPALAVIDDITMPFMQVADKVTRPVVGVADDVVRPAFNAVDDAIRPAITAVDDAARPALNRVRNAGKSFGGSVTSRFNWARNTLNARFYKRLPAASDTERYVYVIDDATNGMHKIGMTTRKPPVRLNELTKATRSKLDYSCIIRTDKDSGLESILKDQFASQKTTHPIQHIGMTEWFVLSAVQVAAACSH